ncbi:OLC1v1023248C1 [Oldenlandia corymbosa var. corymbosa]|uniref:OLC1v1023248C1 n=1 Tax=Oldenlandia corymbosa var. corymbosa TaxID=529605 RepID=A0AAV1BZI5_OLDCO|nr:OLC1v1023248C1 [Oldenlandia corymbosa var. corymbosa]
MPVLPLAFNPFLLVRFNPTGVALFPFVSSKMSSSSSSKAKVVVEYAKSGRSTCKKCSTAIAASSLRLGLVTRDSRGYDTTKWHHLQCLPLNSNAFTSTNSIGGFSSLKSSDQEKVKKLMADSSESSGKVLDEEKDSSSEKNNLLEVGLADDCHGSDLGESKTKRMKLSVSAEGDKLEIAISASDIKDKYKDATLLPQWKAFQTLIFLEKGDGLHASSKIAAFDFDGCLAKTSVKMVGADAWSLMHPSIPEKLQGLYNNGFKLVIFTNESNIERWKNKRQVAIDSKLGRLESFIKLVGVPIQVFIACGQSKGQPEDAYRKPKTGMWHVMEKHFNSGLKIDMDHSFYVGDAAGRKDDHSDADIKFAEAIGLKFYVPEEYFKS